MRRCRPAPSLMHRSSGRVLGGDQQVSIATVDRSSYTTLTWVFASGRR